MTNRLSIAFLSSRNGSLLERMLAHKQYSSSLFSVDLVASNNASAGVFDLARSVGADTFLIDTIDNSASDCALRSAFEERGIEFVILGGYLKKLGVHTVAAYAGRIINVHPSLLPRHGGKGMYGKAVYRSIIESKDPYSGITIHLVDPQYDKGPIVEQNRFRMNPGMTAEELAIASRKFESDLLLNVLHEAADSLPLRGFNNVR